MMIYFTVIVGALVFVLLAALITDYTSQYGCSYCSAGYCKEHDEEK